MKVYTTIGGVTIESGPVTMRIAPDAYPDIIIQCGCHALHNGTDEQRASLIVWMREAVEAFG